MAKSLRTRQKLVYKGAAPPPRNPVALAARLRPAGAHAKTGGALRLEGRRKLRKMVGES